MDQATTDEVTQKAEWRARLIAAIVNREHDDETLVDMLEAGLQQAHSEGVLDAADICQRISEGAGSPETSRVAHCLAVALRQYNERNVHDHAAEERQETQ